MVGEEDVPRAEDEQQGLTCGDPCLGEATVTSARCNSCESENSEDSQEEVLRVPTSIRAMLQRSKRSLTKQELKIMRCSSAEHRCTALRMVFEGRPAEEAVEYILNMSQSELLDSSQNTVSSLATSRISDEEETVGRRTKTLEGGDRVCNTVATHVTQRSRSTSQFFTNEMTTPRRPSPTTDTKNVQHPYSPQTPNQQTPSNLTNLLTSVNSGSERSISPSIRMPSPRSRRVRTVARLLVDLPVNTVSNPITAKGRGNIIEQAHSIGNDHEAKANDPRRPTPRVISSRMPHNDNAHAAGGNASACSSAFTARRPHKTTPQTACSAWDQQLNTFIVHPNQLRRLEELDKRKNFPDAVRLGLSNTLKRPKRGEQKANKQETCACNLRSTEPTNTGQPGGATQDSIPKMCGGLSTCASDKDMKKLSRRRVRRGKLGVERQELNGQAGSVPWIKGMRYLGTSKDVFLRLYSHTCQMNSARAVTARSSRSSPFYITGMQRLASSINFTPRTRPLEVSGEDRQLTGRCRMDGHFSHYGSVQRLQRTESAIEHRYRTRGQAHLKSLLVTASRALNEKRIRRPADCTEP
ncbi:hypothetical protein ERJ75_000931700 [Trypanosoma vivax]|uniref:Uncharacterized protein n=1 Tax=Trypanosoma vivax (strain Y486) TaxID=1055687 RepID=G0U427_TRYVY|nr:hypothetical protein TRVL_02479 [Trypanosoma vivax]KAH8612061.1 hypothetical protein ERJ75_000931700 [Trypanosoma vivax]CCC52189.1 conserved hypothetical protein [Trypanosoma vivax Y486]